MVSCGRRVAARDHGRMSGWQRETARERAREEAREMGGRAKQQQQQQPNPQMASVGGLQGQRRRGRRALGVAAVCASACGPPRPASPSMKSAGGGGGPHQESMDGERRGGGGARAAALTLASWSVSKTRTWPPRPPARALSCAATPPPSPASLEGCPSLSGYEMEVSRRPRAKRKG